MTMTDTPSLTAAAQVTALRTRLLEQATPLPFASQPAGRLAVTKLTSTLAALEITVPSSVTDYFQSVGRSIPADTRPLWAPGSPNRVAFRLYGIEQVIESLGRVTTRAQRSVTHERIPLGTGTVYDVSLEVRGLTVSYVDKHSGRVTQTPLSLAQWLDKAQVDLEDLTPPHTPGMEARGDNAPFETMRAVFDSDLTNFTVDRRWLKQLLLWVAEFENRNEDHINFLGGNLVGVYRLHWRKDDTQSWLDLLGVEDYPDLRTAYHDLPSVNPDFNVVGNPVNASYLYAAHRILISDLADRDKIRGAVAVLCVMHYQFLSSLMYHQFPYRAQEAIALALYESLSRKSMLKQYHSWGNLVKARAEDVLESGSIHRPALDAFGPDDRLIYAISDIQSRIREVVKKLKSEYMRLRDADARVMAQGTTIVNGEGETVLREYENRTESLLRAMRGICADRMDLTRQELLDETLKLVTTADERHLRTTLEYVSAHVEDRRTPEVLELIQRLVRFVQEYARRAPPGEATIVHLVLKVRNLMRSSQLTAPEALALRNLGSEVVEHALDKRSDAVQASSRIALFVYLTLRLLTVNHYS